MTIAPYKFVTLGYQEV